MYGGGLINYGVIATVTERSEEMPVVQSVVFDSLRDAPPPPPELRAIRGMVLIICRFARQNDRATARVAPTRHNENLKCSIQIFCILHFAF